MLHDPRYNKNKYQENKLAYYRVKAGLTVKKLAELAETHTGYIANLQNGMMSPFVGRSQSEIKPCVKRILSILRRDIEEVFVRDVCAVNTKAFTDDQLLHCSCSMHSVTAQNPSEYGSSTVFWKVLARSGLPPKYMRILKQRFLNGDTFADVSKTLGLSRARVQQIEIVALRRLRRNIKVKDLLIGG